MAKKDKGKSKDKDKGKGKSKDKDKGKGKSMAVKYASDGPIATSYSFLGLYPCITWTGSSTRSLTRDVITTSGAQTKIIFIAKLEGACTRTGWGSF